MSNHAPPLTKGALPTKEHWARLEEDKEHWLGHKFTLWTTSHRRNFYEDQFGVAHDAYVVEEEIRVKVVEVRLVPGVWRQTDWHAGFKAVEIDPKSGAEKDRSFYCNWKSFDDASTSPFSTWGRQGIAYYHATLRFENQLGKPILTLDKKKAIPLGELECPFHRGYLVGKDGTCFQCKMQALKETA
jgi:hypothetical protein